MITLRDPVVCLFRVDAKEMALAAKRAPAKGANGLGVWLETVFTSRERFPKHN